MLLSPLFRHSLRRSVGRKHNPRVARLLPHRDGRRREIRVGEVADGNNDISRKTFAFPIDGGSAGRAEVKGHDTPAFGRPLPRCRLASEDDLIGPKARLVADDGAGTALASQAVAHGDTRWFTFDRKVKLPAAAGGVSDSHASNRPLDFGRLAPRTAESRPLSFWHLGRSQIEKTLLLFLLVTFFHLFHSCR